MSSFDADRIEPEALPFQAGYLALGLDIRLEDTTNHGRIGMAVLFRQQVFEFKVVADAATGEALQQIKAKGYAQKYPWGGAQRRGLRGPDARWTGSNSKPTRWAGFRSCPTWTGG